jgi:hypothetical protein
MSNLTMGLGVLVVLIVLVSLVYTLRVGKGVSERKSKMDTQLSEKVQEHPYSRNPVFLAYLIAALVVLAYIFYLAYTISW